MYHFVRAIGFLIISLVAWRIVKDKDLIWFIFASFVEFILTLIEYFQSSELYIQNVIFIIRIFLILAIIVVGLKLIKKHNKLEKENQDP